MRKFKLLALALVIGTASLFATNTNNPDVVKKEIRTQIIDLLGAPDFTVADEINVTISFTFSSEGEIVVLDVNSKNRDVLNFVRENLNYKKIDNPGERDKLYTMPLKVKAA
jgi:hypothetical protein